MTPIKSNLPALLPGDLVFFKTFTWLGKVIRKLTQSSGESKTEANHVGIMADSIDLIEADITVIKHPLSDYFGQNMMICIYRNTVFTIDERIRVVEKAESYIGRKYGVLKILAHMGDYFIGNRYFFRKMCKMDNYPICSWVTGWSYFKALQYRFNGLHPQFQTPDDQLDQCQNDWHCVLSWISLNQSRLQ